MNTTKAEILSKFELKVSPPKDSRPAPTFKVQIPWEVQKDSKSKPIPKTSDPRRRRKVKVKKKLRSKTSNLLKLPVNNPDLPKKLERDNSFMLPADHPEIKLLFGNLREESEGSQNIK
mmetsp:Transcript_13908/g.21014  ORF Transcript_13908/g.21014 Transcript_13908/m.21014 type:complete len:118 (-) Transcript_13908:42-395(-)